MMAASSLIIILICSCLAIQCVCLGDICNSDLVGNSDTQRLTMKAVVLGGTGAIGKELLGQLLTNSKIESVVAIGRREAKIPETYKDFKSELKNVVVNMDSLKEEARDAVKDADVVFWTLGTTRKDAGDAETFKKVELEYLKSAATLAKEQGVKHFSIVTSQGANPNFWTSDWKIAHPLLYPWVKGQAEECVKQQGFPRVSIFRPGLLDRSPAVRGIEKWLSLILPSVRVADVARVMVLDAVSESGKAPVRVYEDADIKKAAKANALFE